MSHDAPVFAFAVGIGRYSKRFVEAEELLRRRFQDPAQSPQLPDRDVLEAGLDLCIGTPRQVTAFDLQPGRNLLLGQARLYPAPPDIVPDGGLPFDCLVQTMHGLSYLMT